MKSSDLRKLTPEELKDRVREDRDHLFSLQIKHATGQLENSAGIREARRNLARVLTIEKQLKDGV
ncbi:MAG: 50S ribosomal protein L29 [bacterium]|nr:50S ribosomal protein L29 [bacterium]